MIGKVIQRAGFSTAVEYVLRNPTASVLSKYGLLSESAKGLTQEFEFIANQQHNAKKCMWHAILSIAKDDIPKVNDTILKEMGNFYLKEAGFDNHQYLMVKHSET